MDDGLDDRSLGKLFKVFIEVDFKLLFFFISILACRGASSLEIDPAIYRSLRNSETGETPETKRKSLARVHAT